MVAQVIQRGNIPLLEQLAHQSLQLIHTKGIRKQSSNAEQWFQTSLTIGKGEPDKTFDPKSVWNIGVLLETTDGTTLSFNGSIYIDDCFVGHID